MGITNKTTAAAPPADVTMSYEDFLDQYADIHAEWVDGRVEFMAAVSYRHDKVSSFLQYLIDAFINIHQLGELMKDPMQTKLGPDLPGRQPDLMFVRNERKNIIKANFVDGPPDLTVEVVSLESRARDYGDKADEYERAGVGEYWIVDPLRNDALFYQLDDDGLFHRVSPDAEGRYHSTVLPGLILDVALLWVDPLPGIMEAVEIAQAMTTS